MENIIAMLSERYKVVLSDESAKQLKALLICKQYPTNEKLIDPDKICRDLYIIEKGIVRQFYYKEGRDITEHFSCEGDITFCIESLFLKKTTSLFMETIEPCTIYHLNYEQFKILCDQRNDINNLYRQIFEQDLILTQCKADSWRFESSRERYVRFCKDYPSVNKRASVSHIASYLLMAPETLSRVRAGVL